MINKKPTPIILNDKQYNNLLVALQGLYTDTHATVERVASLEIELGEVKKTLIEILKYQKSLVDFEKTLFKKNLHT